MKWFFMLFLFMSFKQAPSNKAVVRSCGTKDWSKVKCKVLSENPYGTKMDTIHYGENAEIDLKVFVGSIGHTLRNINNSKLSCTGDDGRLAQLKSYTRGLVRKRRLTTCQKACVVKCITANYLTYAENSRSYASQSPCQAANSGSGKCIAFSNLADHLMDDLGLQSRSVANKKHAFNQVKIGKKWYLMEPQDERCRFIK